MRSSSSTAVGSLPDAICVLASGGLDSAVLVATLARRRRVHPLYVRSGLNWEWAERALLARFLAAHPRVERVFYPGLASHPDHDVATRQFRGGFGGMVSFLLRGDLAATARFVDACRLATIGPSMGGVETLIEQPAYMSFYELSSEQRAAIGIADNLVRLSVDDEAPRGV